jgi:hypothetical protein
MYPPINNLEPKITSLMKLGSGACAVHTILLGYLNPFKKIPVASTSIDFSVMVIERRSISSSGGVIDNPLRLDVGVSEEKGISDAFVD